MKTPCTECGNTHPQMIRGLCKRCYQNARCRAGINFERKTMANADLIEEIRWLGFDPRFPIRPQFRNLAPHLGMDYKTAERAWYRHQQKTRSVA